MRTVATSNDMVRLSFLQALLADAGIEALLLDAYASVTEGSAAAIQRRIVVADRDEAHARRVLAEAGEA
jgi:putative signal transducing protein